MRKNISRIVLVAIIFGWSCQTQNKESNGAQVAEKPNDSTDEYSHLPQALLAGLNAHGGINTWKKYGKLSYNLTKEGSTESQLIDLYSRKVLITGPDYKIGYDGERVWITPDMEAFGERSPRFYHNLYFYFFSIPFVFSDPGINYEVLPEKEINGKIHDVVKISFDQGVGDASGDYYIAHFDQQTHQLHLLLYTVTYFSGESHENYNAIIYHEWQNAGGLMVPKLMKGYKYAEGEIGEQRYEAQFDKVVFEEKAPGPSLFVMPANAEIDSLKVSS